MSWEMASEEADTTTKLSPFSELSFCSRVARALNPQTLICSPFILTVLNGDYNTPSYDQSLIGIIVPLL